MTKAASIIDITANSTVSEALAIQSSLMALSAEIKTVRGHRDDAEFKQYLLTALGAAEMGIKPNSKGSTALREAFVSAGRSKRNSETIVQACLNKRVAALAKHALANGDNPVDALRAALADNDVDSVSSLKRWLAPATNVVAELIKKIEKLEGDDAELFEAAIGEWMTKRELARDADTAGDVADAA
jgi:hypothetical protein